MDAIFLLIKLRAMSESRCRFHSIYIYIYIPMMRIRDGLANVFPFSLESPGKAVFMLQQGLITLHWRHNDHDGVSNHQPHGCLLNRLFRRISKKTSKLRVSGRCVGKSPGPVNSPHKGPITRKMLPFDDVIMPTPCRRSGMISQGPCSLRSRCPVPKTPVIVSSTIL